MWKDKQRTNRSNHETRFPWWSGLLPVCEHVPTSVETDRHDPRQATGIVDTRKERDAYACRPLCKYVTNSTGNSVFEMPAGIWARGSVLTEYLIRAGTPVLGKTSLGVSYGLVGEHRPTFPSLPSNSVTDVFAVPQRV